MDHNERTVLQAMERELRKHLSDRSNTNKKLSTFLRSVFANEAEHHPLSMLSLSMSGRFALPKAIFIPPSQIITLMAEYDADTTAEELLRRHSVESGECEEQREKIRYADNLLLATAGPRRAVHMTNILFELGKSIVFNSISTVGKETESPSFKCHLCSFKTESRIVLETHKEMPHYVRSRYRCSFCAEFFGNLRETKSHFLNKHGVNARSDYWCTAFECSFCASKCGSRSGTRQHQKLCRFAKDGFTMVATRNQASCAINICMWETENRYGFSNWMFERTNPRIVCFWGYARSDVFYLVFWLCKTNRMRSNSFLNIIGPRKISVRKVLFDFEEVITIFRIFD